MAEHNQFTRTSATAQISPSGAGAYLERIIIEDAATSPTITLRNGGSAGILVLETFIVAAGDILEIGIWFDRGIHYTEVGAITCTFIWH